MTRTIDETSLERAIVRHCSPTLAGLKPASLFTFPGDFTAPDAAARRCALEAAMDACAHQVMPAGLALCVLAWRSCGALVYVYRPHELAAYLADRRAAVPLSRAGYDLSTLESCLATLAERLSAMEGKRPAAAQAAGQPCPCTKRGCARAFPHELGFFLGYPYEDVSAFIEHAGQDYLAVGPWKVYSNLEGALATFARFRTATAKMLRAHESGSRLMQLAVATTR